MTQQPDPLHLFDAQQRAEEHADIPSRADLLHRWLHGDLSFQDYTVQMDTYYPMSVEELRASLTKPYVPFWESVISRMEARRAGKVQAK